MVLFLVEFDCSSARPLIVFRLLISILRGLMGVGSKFTSLQCYNESLLPWQGRLILSIIEEDIMIIIIVKCVLAWQRLPR